MLKRTVFDKAPQAYPGGLSGYAEVIKSQIVPNQHLNCYMSLVVCLIWLIRFLYPVGKCLSGACRVFCCVYLCLSVQYSITLQSLKVDPRNTKCGIYF